MMEFADLRPGRVIYNEMSIITGRRPSCEKIVQSVFNKRKKMSAKGAPDGPITEHRVERCTSM